MEQQTPMSLRNRTGMKRSPIDARHMLDWPGNVASPETGPQGTQTTPREDDTPEEIRATYLREGGTLGSVPPPANLKGAIETGIRALTGIRMQALMDKLGERLAFERAGTRLYESALRRCEMSARDGEQGPSLVGGLDAILRDEASHALMLQEAIEALGGDPTCQTPCAAATAMQGMGLIQVMTEPRTTLAQTLSALLTAELVDNEGWSLLIEMMEQAGQDDWARRFREAAEREEMHLSQVREWHRQAVLADVDPASGPH